MGCRKLRGWFSEGRATTQDNNESAFRLNVSQGLNGLERVFPKWWYQSSTAPAVLDRRWIARQSA
jgi:hypothetical protein